MPGKVTRDQVDSAITEGEREQREESATRRLLKQARNQVADLEKKVDLLTAIDGVHVQPSRWSTPPKSKASTGVANLLFSDLHLDERVTAGQVNGRNAYSRQIAELRLKATVHKTIRLARDHITGITYDGIQVWWGGDTVSGGIHDELKETNDG